MIKELILELPDRSRIPVGLIRSARKTMGLEVKPDGTVTARLPNRVSDAEAVRFLHSHREWIASKLALARERQRLREGRPVPDYVKDPSLERRYREAARTRLLERASYFSAVMDVDFLSLSVRAAKTRWGSCSSRGSLNFHWKLILMPPKILDYVVVHELAHRKEMNHSPRFWAIVASVLPDYRERRQWLREHGQEY